MYCLTQPDFYLFSTLVIIVFTVIKFNESQFGAWRHLYFLYPIIVTIALFGFQYVNIGLASGFFHVVEYTTHVGKSMEHLCSFRTLTLLSASVFKMHFHV